MGDPCELVQVVTGDGLRLDGALTTPISAADSPASLDAVVCLHGAGSNFYGSSLLAAIARRLAERQVATLRVNTRGHDWLSIATTPGGGRRQGAAYEIVDDCRQDVAAWLDCLLARGYRRIGLWGHSLGAIKAIYAAAHGVPPEVACVVAISPPRLSYARFLMSPQRDLFQATLNRAGEEVAAGRPEALLDVTFPLPLTITASGYLEKYGPEERYNIIRYLPAAGRPTLLTFGEKELGGAGFRDLPEEIQGLPNAPHVQVRVVAGADHHYTGVQGDLLAHVESWLRRLGAPT